MNFPRFDEKTPPFHRATPFFPPVGDCSGSPASATIQPQRAKQKAVAMLPIAACYPSIKAVGSIRGSRGKGFVFVATYRCADDDQLDYGTVKDLYSKGVSTRRMRPQNERRA
jgi:hypothetical protein